jgi:hypothetical protein
MMPLFRISAMLRPKAVRNVVPSFGRLALAKRRLAKAKLLPVRTTWSTISAVGISTRPLLLAPLDLAPQERLLVSGAHSPRARWAGRRSSRLYAKRLIFSRALARRHQPPAVRSFDLGSCPSFESSTTIISSNLVLLVLRSSAPSCCAFGLVCAGPEGLIYSPAPILHAPPLLVNGICVLLRFLYPRLLSLRPAPRCLSCGPPCHIPPCWAGRFWSFLGGFFFCDLALLYVSLLCLAGMEASIFDWRTKQRLVPLPSYPMPNAMPSAKCPKAACSPPRKTRRLCGG